MPDQTFPIYGNEISWTHDAFVVDYNPTPHALCGTLEKTVKFDTEGVNTDVTDSTVPLSYENNGDVRTFKLQSDDPNFIGTGKKYSTTVGFPAWPTTAKTEVGEITFGNQCDNPFTFSGVTQTNHGPDNLIQKTLDPNNLVKSDYTVWSLTEFNITPVQCLPTIVYSVDKILDPDGLEVNTVSGDNYVNGQAKLFYYDFDGVVDGDLDTGENDDGKLLFGVYQNLYEFGVHPPGVWTITIKGTSSDG